MKNTQTLTLPLTMVLIMVASVTQATLLSYTYSTGFSTTNVPDGNLVGIADSRSISGIPDPAGDGTTPVITDVNVRINISGGFNGDLYGYLRLQNENNDTVLSVLLNRVGQGTGSEPVTSFGFSTSGMNVTLDDQAALNIHNVPSPNSGASYQSDASTLASLINKRANGIWTLFLADLSGGGGQTTLVSWGLDISVVPEPTTWALIIFAVAVAGHVVARRFRPERA